MPISAAIKSQKVSLDRSLTGHLNGPSAIADEQVLNHP